ncbi:MAG: helix-turn-helix domain-containing protein [Lachnospiraceae bacterium]|nr:helix-turn-helix domain-containing protein [Lachnospiraceae bacterium]
MTKIDILKENGTFNESSKRVTAEDFQHGVFFDPNDLFQVKYEMLRSVEKGDMSVSDAAEKYGFSRQSYYVNKVAFENGGLAGLIPKKTGPRHGHKLTDEGKKFIDEYLNDHPTARPHEINTALELNTGITVHDRTVDRYLSKKQHGSR